MESRYSLGSSALLLLAETSISVLLEERLLSGRIREERRKLLLLRVFFRILPTPGVPGVSLTPALPGVPLTSALPGEPLVHALPLFFVAYFKKLWVVHGNLQGEEARITKILAVEEKQRTKNASCSELEDEKASCSELQSLPLPGEPGSYICRWLPGPWVASYGLRVQTRLTIPFSTTAEPYSMRFAQLAMGCSNPAFFFETVSPCSWKFLSLFGRGKIVPPCRK